MICSYFTRYPFHLHFRIHITAHTKKGILSGSQRSEFLAEPFKSIPDGTIGAVLISTSIYIVVVWLFGLTIANYTLKTNKFILAAVAFPQDQVVKVGVIVSCIG